MCDLLLGPPLLHCISGGKLGAEDMCIGGLGIVIGRWAMGSIYTDISILGWGYGAIRGSTHVGYGFVRGWFRLGPRLDLRFSIPLQPPFFIPPAIPLARTGSSSSSSASSSSPSSSLALGLLAKSFGVRLSFSPSCCATTPNTKQPNQALNGKTTHPGMPLYYLVNVS